MPGIFGQVTSAVSSIISPVRKIVDDVTTSDEERLKAKAKLDEIENAARAKFLKHVQNIISAQKEVLLAELKGNWMQRSWRPLLMYVFILIIFNNFIVAPYVDAFAGTSVFLEFPTFFWQIMTVSIGGYIGARTYEKKKGVSDQRAGQAKTAVDRLIGSAALQEVKPAPINQNQKSDE